jgi:hypothetical protein
MTRGKKKQVTYDDHVQALRDIGFSEAEIRVELERDGFSSEDAFKAVVGVFYKKTPRKSRRQRTRPDLSEHWIESRKFPGLMTSDSGLVADKERWLVRKPNCSPTPRGQPRERIYFNGAYINRQELFEERAALESREGA